jgi:hypothetical protein
MKKPSIWRVIGVVAGFCVSFGATFWTIAISPEIHGIGNRIGLTSAFASALGASLFFWAVGFAYIARELNWSHRACRYAGAAFLLPGSLIILTNSRPMTVASILVCQAAITSYIARKIGFPEMSDEEAAGPEPLPTMFPK